MLLHIIPLQQKTVNYINLISYEELNAINSYLESKGLSTDTEKQEYFNHACNDILHRSEKQDTELKDLLLSYQPNIVYADGLHVRYYDNNHIFAHTPKGRDYVITEDILAEAKIRKDSNTPQNIFDPKIKMELPLISLHTEDIKVQMKQDREDFETKLPKIATSENTTISPITLTPRQNSR